MRADYFFLPAFALLVFACGGNQTETAEEIIEEEVLTAPADADWTTLFDGTSLDAFHAYGRDTVGSAWQIVDGALHFNPEVKDSEGNTLGGDIVTNESFANYELELEWKIGPCGNSGIIYNVIENDELDYAWMSGPEMQVLDNTCHPDAKIYKHRAGDLYDMIAGDSLQVKPQGEWNQVRLVVTDGMVEHHLNGKKVVEYPNTGEKWETMIANSKFKTWKAFGTATSGKIALQDHSDPVWYRNIRIRQLADR